MTLMPVPLSSKNVLTSPGDTMHIMDWFTDFCFILKVHANIILCSVADVYNFRLLCIRKRAGNKHCGSQFAALRINVRMFGILSFMVNGKNKMALLNFILFFIIHF